jgi:hypothetical protein
LGAVSWTHRGRSFPVEHSNFVGSKGKGNRLNMKIHLILFLLAAFIVGALYPAPVNMLRSKLGI